MHSSLRKELCGTPKVLQSLRSRSIYLSSPQSRRFSNRTRLFSQPNSKDNSSNCASEKPSPGDSPTDSTSSSHTPAQSVSANLEKWIEVLGEKGHSLPDWESISEKDENGKPKLLPHIKAELEKLAQRRGPDGKDPGHFGIEIRDGQVRPMTLNEVKEYTKARADRSHGYDKFIITSKDVQTGPPFSQPPLSATSSTQPRPSQNVKSQEQEVNSNTSLSSGNTEALKSSDPVTRFHGSYAARRQRERQSRIRERSPTFVLPEWFSEQNVQVYAQSTTSSQTTAGEPTHAISPERFVNSETGAEESERSHAPENSTAELAAQEVVAEPRTDIEEPELVEKEQTFASGPASDAPESNAETGTDSSAPAADAEDMPALVAIPGANKNYYIQQAQREELTMTARGRLRLPTTPSSANKRGGIRSHILVHYTAQDGDIFLDKLIEDLARQLQSNLITLDAQDISALVSKADVDPLIAEEAKTLSYDIYTEIYGQESQDDEQPSMFSEDMEDADEEGGPPSQQGFPFMGGRAITVDLKALFGNNRSPRRGNGRFTPKNMMSDLMMKPAMSKSPPPVFSAIIESILSAPNSMKRDINTDKDSQDTTSEASGEQVPKHTVTQEPTIVHIKDLKAIQDTNLGKDFLFQLYEQVDRRRNYGERIMLIGTSCDRDNSSVYDAERIKTLQVSEPDEISSTIIITPAYSSDDVIDRNSEQEIRYELQRNVIPKRDRAQRLATINARHLYEMLQSKDVSLGSLKDGFWTRNFPRQLDDADRDCLEKSFWSFAYIQRLAAILASTDFPNSNHSISHAARVLSRSDELKYKWARITQPEKSRKQGRKDKSQDQPEDEKLARIRAKATKHEKKLLGGVVEPRKIATTFQDIHIPAETVDALQTLTTLSLVRPDAFKYGVLASDRIPGLLLYGPPGTGKTLAAKAVARESGATMLEVSAADINDMYVGEGEKNVKALFSLAKKLSPCVVFLDEADAMFSARSTAGRRVSHRELLNQFLKEWDGMSNDAGSAFIMVATNRPMDLDDAVLRRLPRRLLVDLPTEKDRLEILKIHLRHENVASDVDLAKLATRTPFYSGSDLKNVAVAAALNCVREENALAKQHTGSEEYKYPETRTLTSEHFDRALEEISASISEDMASLREIKKFDEQYGDRKGRKRRSPKWGFKTATEADAVLDTVKVRQ